MTRHVPYDEFAKHLPKYLDKVRKRPVYVDHKDRSVVVLSAEEYETLQLLRGNNRKELLDAIADADAGKFVEHGLIRK